jgi:hypothetical protein
MTDTIQAGSWIECVDARDSGGALVVGKRYPVARMENATNVWIDGVGPHFWHICRFILVDGPLETAGTCGDCGAPAKVVEGLCRYCTRRKASGPSA